MPDARVRVLVRTIRVGTDVPSMFVRIPLGKDGKAGATERYFRVESFWVAIWAASVSLFWSLISA